MQLSLDSRGPAEYFGAKAIFCMANKKWVPNIKVWYPYFIRDTKNIYFLICSDIAVVTHVLNASLRHRFYPETLIKHEKEIKWSGSWQNDVCSPQTPVAKKNSLYLLIFWTIYWSSITAKTSRWITGIKDFMKINREKVQKHYLVLRLKKCYAL